MSKINFKRCDMLHKNLNELYLEDLIGGKQ